MRRLPKPYSFKSSPVGANGKLYMASEDGDVVVVKMGEKFEVLATNTLTDQFFVPHRPSWTERSSCAGRIRCFASPASTDPKELRMRFLQGVTVLLFVLQSGLPGAQQVTIPFNSIHESITLTAVNNQGLVTKTVQDTLAFSFPPGFPADPNVCMGKASASGGPTCQFVEAHLSPDYDQAQISVVNKGPRASIDVLPRLSFDVPFGGNNPLEGSYDFECDTLSCMTTVTFMANPNPIVRFSPLIGSLQVTFDFILYVEYNGPPNAANLTTSVTMGATLSGEGVFVVPDGLVVPPTPTAPPPPVSKKQSGKPACPFGDPCDVASGAKFEQVADYQTAGPNPLGFTRYYNSIAGSGPATFASSLGSYWRGTYDRYIDIVSASSVLAERADGRVLTFASNGGAWTTDPDVDLKLTQTGSGIGSTWTLTDSNDTVETYTTISASEANLTKIQARNGYTQSLQYDSSNRLVKVLDSFGRSLQFTYQGGLLQTLTTPDGLVLTYGYNSSGATAGVNDRLASVAYSTTPPTSQTYLYENSSLPFALTGITDENGARYSTWAYDTAGRATSSQHAGGANLTQITYNSDGTRTVTHPLGQQETYTFTTLQGVPKVTKVSRVASATTAAATRTVTYDANGYVASQTDWNGNVTAYVNNARGEPTSVTEASGTAQARTTTIAWDPVLHLPTKIVEPGLTNDFVYDPSGNLSTRTLTDTTTTSVPYSTSGTKRVWTYTWSNGLLMSVKGPRTDVPELTSFAYDASGALIKMTNALGQQTQITQHTPGGLPQTIVDPNNVTTQVAYDARLRPRTATIGAAAGPLTTAYGTDAAGNLLSVTLPDSSALTNAYDTAHRLISVTDLFNQQTAYTLDALGSPTQTALADPTGVTQLSRSSSLDALGRVLKDTGGAGQVTTYTYDSNGNLLTIADPLNHVTRQAFDSLNHLMRVTDAAGGVSSATFDPHDRPLAVTAPNGAVTSYIYDGFGDVIQITSPDAGKTVFHYDLAGNMTQKVDATGATVNYTYDAVERVLTATYPAAAAENVTYRYDEAGHGFGVGRLTSITDAAGTLTRTYDERGNVLKETRASSAATLATTYTYDAASRVASITYPSGWAAVYTRDAMGRTTAVTARPPGGGASIPILAGAGYQPFGPINGLTFGNGVAEARTFDLDYRPTGVADAGAGVLQNLAYAYDAANNVSSITDSVTAGNSQSLGYDALYRLTSAAGGYGALSYTYDGSGNRMSASAGGSTMAYAYVARTNQLSAVTAGGVRQAIGYDKAGNVNNFNPAAAGAITKASYNQSGRLATVMAGSNLAAQYTYDAFGQRLVKVGAVTGTTLYQYDQGSHLLEETDGQGNPLADYIYVDDLPVAALSPGAGQVYFLHDDRLGAPQAATDSGQNVVWTASYGPFGEMSAVPSLIVQDLRLPGQEFDADTGLYHNGFRDYAPGWGRYLQSDPVGIAGGMNTYGYVGGNPVNWIDPLGLAQTYFSLYYYRVKRYGEDAWDVTGIAAFSAIDGALRIGQKLAPGVEAPELGPVGNWLAGKAGDKLVDKLFDSEINLYDEATRHYFDSFLLREPEFAGQIGRTISPFLGVTDPPCRDLNIPSWLRPRAIVQ